MELVQFTESIRQEKMPESISVYLQCLWYDGKGDWEQAHTMIQDLPDTTAAWLHAYLHRKEGDIWNADYWYSKAGRKRPALTLNQEWEAIVQTLL